MFGSMFKPTQPAKAPEHPRSFMTRNEAVRMVVMVAVLVGMVGFLIKMSKQLTEIPDAPMPAQGDDAVALDPAEVPKDPDAGASRGAHDASEPSELERSPEAEASDDAAGASAPSQVTRRAEVAAREEQYRKLWDEKAAEYGLPSWSERTHGIDPMLMSSVTDGTEERETAAYFALLNWVKERSHEEIAEVVNPDVDLDWLRLPQSDLDKKLEAASATRGQVVEVYGRLHRIYTREVEGENPPKPWIYDAYITDKDRNVWLICCYDKEFGFTPGEDIVKAVGPFFKLIKVETTDPDPKRRFKGFPTLVVKSLQRVTVAAPKPGLFANPLAAVFGAVLSIGTGLLGLVWWRGRNAPPLPARRRSMLNNERLRGLDKTKGAEQPDAAAVATSADAEAKSPATETEPDAAAPPAPNATPCLPPPRTP